MVHDAGRVGGGADAKNPRCMVHDAGRRRVPANEHGLANPLALRPLGRPDRAIGLVLLARAMALAVDPVAHGNVLAFAMAIVINFLAPTIQLAVFIALAAEGASAVLIVYDAFRFDACKAQFKRVHRSPCCDALGCRCAVNDACL